MIARAGFLAARLAALAVFLLTWAYVVTTHSAFAFDMFVKPQLSKALTDFVTWHPAWFTVAYVLSAMTLVPAIRQSAASRRQHAARTLAAGYVLVFGAITVWLSGGAYLASLSGGGREVVIALGALVPILWLALIDHLSHGAETRNIAGHNADQSLLLRATTVTALLLWFAHCAWTWVDTAATVDTATMAAGSGWALLFDLGVAQIVYLALVLACACAAGRSRRWEYVVAVLWIAIALAEFVRRVVLPPLAFTVADSALIAVPFAVTIAATWSGLRLSGGARSEDGLVAVLAAPAARPATAMVLAIATMALAIYATEQIERLDWAFILRQLIAIVEAMLVFAFVLRAVALAPRRQEWSMRLLVVPPLLALLAMHAVPRLAMAFDAGPIRTALDPQAGVERAIAMDPLARVAASAFISNQPLDSAFFRRMLDDESSNWSLSPAVPANAVEPFAPAGAPPHVFVIVLDSLRRDYLTAYNPAVTFAPAIDQWARESFVFRNAFTPYGGTALAMPSLWAGRSVPRGWQHILKQINRLEHVIASSGYDFLINDHTVRQELRAETKRTFLNPYIASPQTDLCENLAAVQAHVRRRSTTQPVFAFLAPMNVHILNTRVGTGAESYPGFHAPYAGQLERADRCFGTFISFLKSEQLYDRSIIVLTSDHGDSLGEGDRWGHQLFLFPEIVRIPLIIGLPATDRARMTTDLGRVALLTDVTPTLMSLIGGQAIQADPPDGGTLFVPASEQLRSRRRQSFMLMSSYGPVFGLVRRGRDMYMTDLRNWQEYAFALEPVGYRQVALTDALRRVSQADLLKHMEAIRRVYGRK